MIVVTDKLEQAVLANKLKDTFTIFTARNPQEAIEVMRLQPVEIIVCHTGNAVANGQELCTRLKASRSFCHIPVILLTADDGLQASITGLEMGADVTIAIPFSWQYLEVQMKNLIANRQRVLAHMAHAPACQPPGKEQGAADFIQQLHHLIAGNAPDQSLTVERLAKLMNMSRPTFYRKLRTHANTTPNELIVRLRLQQAATLLASARYKVFEVAQMVGFCSQSTFGKAFLKEFKVTPTQYRRMMSNHSPRHGGQAFIIDYPIAIGTPFSND